MATVYRGYTFSGIINLKQDDGTAPENLLPYVIPVGSTVQVILPGESGPVILDSTVALPNPPFSANEVTIVNASLGQIAFTCTPDKSTLLAVGTKQAVDVVVIKDPATTPTPEDVDVFEKLKTIDIADIANS
jgi:hypothetical protein